MRTVLIVCFAAAFLPACGDDLRPLTQPDAEAVPDAEIMPDAMVCPAPAFGAIGGPCDSDDDCGARPNSTCYFGALGPVVFAAEGYCMDDDFSLALGTCVADGDCATGEICVEWTGFAGYKSCLPACSCVGNTCPVNQGCLMSFNGLGLDRAACVPGNADAVDGSACDGLYECDEASTCFDDAEYPDGECQRYSCTVGDDTTCNGGHCVTDPDPPVSASTTCVDTCTGNGDCRTAEGYVCFDPDGVGTAANYCRHPRVGDPCTTAADCGGAPFVCKTGITFMGGLCSLDGCAPPGDLAGCTDGSVCFDDPLSTTNYCVDRCDGFTTCRTGYTCTDTDPGGPSVGGCTPL